MSCADLLRRLFIVLAASLIVAVSVTGAETDSSRVSDTVLFIPDTTSNAARVDNPDNFEQHLTQPPTQGLFKSFIIPGWGQLGNKRVFKAGFFFGLQALMVGASMHFDSQADDYFRQYNNSTVLADRNVYYGLYDNERNRRNQYRWFAVITAVLAGFDAYVDAHLSGSPAGRKDRALSFEPMPMDNELGLSLSLSF